MSRFQLLSSLFRSTTRLSATQTVSRSAFGALKQVSGSSMRLLPVRSSPSPLLLGSKSFSTFSSGRSAFGLNASTTQIFMERKDKKGKKGQGKKVDMDDAVGVDIASAKAQLAKPIAFLQKSYSTLRPVKTSPSLLDPIQVETKSGKKAINTLGQISVKDPQTLVVHLFEESSATLNAVIKAVRDAKLGLVAEPSGPADIKIALPKLTTEYREGLVKMADKLSEQAKNGVRSARKSLMDDVKKLQLPKDEAKRAEAVIQTLIDETIKEITSLFEKKEKELMS